MSYFAIQIGNCGNRLGHSFFTTLADITSKKRKVKDYEFLDKSDLRFFSYDENEDKKYANAIMLNTDPWVIQDITKQTNGSWCYRSDSYKLLKSEILNTWPLGYKVYGPSFKEFILNAIRKEIECFDQFLGFLLFGSISGNASSGVGSYVTELLRDEYPSVSLANISVWPFQNEIGGSDMYNAILNLSSLQNFSDAIFLLENDYLMKLCQQKMGMEDACMGEFNSVASYQLANLFLPFDSYYSTLNDMLSLLVSHPQFKIINLRSVPQEPLSSLPFCSYDWSTLFRSLRRILLYNTDTNEVSARNHPLSPSSSPPVTLTNLLLLRGKDCESADTNYLHKPLFPYASWVPKSSRIKIWAHPNSFLSCDRTALLANNGQLSIKGIEKMTEDVWKYFTRKSFFHYFEQHGLSEKEFYLSYLDVQQIVCSYKSLTA